MKKALYIVPVFFVIMMILYAQDALHVFTDGNVGIGVESATQKLEVGGSIKANGRIMDKTGDVMPVGTILPFAGPINKVPPGWLPCDGRTITKTESNGIYAELFDLLGDSWGGAGNGINIPDLRGVFLRGVDNMGTGGAGNDPYKTENNGIERKVGTSQNDAFQGHWHILEGYAADDGIYGCSPTYIQRDCEPSNGYYIDNDEVRTPISDGKNGTPRISAETRPKNVAVNYIIKY